MIHPVYIRNFSKEQLSIRFSSWWNKL